MKIDFSKLISAEAIAADRLATDRAQISAAADAFIDAVAQERGYKSQTHLSSYVTSTIPKWADEAMAFVAWRDATWTEVIKLQATLDRSGERPTTEAILAALPKIVWP
jgi:hypothetical protein